MIAIFKHELKSYFHNMTAYVFGVFLLLFTGIFMMVINLNAGVSNFEFVLESLCLIFIIIVPILTMRIIAEEKKQKTDQLLYSLPLTMSEIVIGKYLALLVVFIVPVLIICLYPFILSFYGNIYFPISYGTIFAFFCLGACLLAVGMFISSTTESQPMAAGVCFVVMIINYYLSSLSDYISSSAFGSFVTLIIFSLLLSWIAYLLTKNQTLMMGINICLLIIITTIYLINADLFTGLLPSIVSKISLFERFSVFVNGTFDITGVVYYVTIMIFFVYLTIQSMEKRRYN